MPFKSQAQAGYFHTHKAELEKEGVDVDEWDKATKGKKLPKRAKKTHKMNATSKLVRLSELSHNLDSVIKFDYDDDNKRSLAGTAVKGAGLAGLGTAGLYGYGLKRRGVDPGKFGGGLYKAAGTDIHNVGSAMASGRVPTAAVGDIGKSIGAGARGIGQQVGGALAKLRTLLPGLKMSSRGETIQFDEHLLEPWGDQPKTKIVQEEFPAGLSPAAVLKFPFPKLMKYLNRKEMYRQQYSGFSSIGKLMQLNAKLTELQFQGEDEKYKPRPIQRYLLGPGLTTAIHAPKGNKLKGFFHTSGRAIGESAVGSAAGAGIGAGLGAGIGALTGRPGAAKLGASAGLVAGSQIGGTAGALHGVYGKRATDLYKRYTDQEHLSSLLDDLIEFDDPTKKKISGRLLKG